MKCKKLLTISFLFLALCGCKDCPEPPAIEECVIESYNGTCFCVNKLYPDGQEFPITYCDGYAATSPQGRVALHNYIESLCKIIKDCK